MAGRPCRPLAERFWEKVEILGPDDCWEWQACRDIYGYGRVGLGGRSGGTERAYRVAYTLIYGPIPAGQHVRHFVCNNPPCCNFMHLLLGEREDNIADMHTSGRYKNAPPLAVDPYRNRWQPPPDPEYVCHTCGIVFSRPYGRRQTGKHTYCCREHYFAAKEFRLEERFWEKIDKRGADECWPWKAGCNRRGYGIISRPGGGTLQAHRVAWEIAHGAIPAGQRVRHYECDNPPCCNVAHMRLGTPWDNSQDMVRKGRQATGQRSPRSLHPDSYAAGEAHANAKLTEREVKAIRALYAAGGHTHKTLGARFGVSAAIAGRIVSRRMWKHVD